MLTSECLHQVLYFSTEYHNSRYNYTVILFWKYLVDIRREAWLNLFWEHINGKLFALHAIFMTNLQMILLSVTTEHDLNIEFRI